MLEESGTEVLSRAVELLIKVERGQGPPVPLAVWLRHEFRRLTAMEAEQGVAKARALLSAAHNLAVATREGAIGQDEAHAELITTFPGFDLKSYRLALTWGLYLAKR